jgi:hypothetical protein
LLRGDATVLSPAFLYWKTREAMGDDYDDTGSNMRTGLDVLLKTGVCPESAMPYQAGDWATPPSDAAVAAADAYRIATYARLMSIVEIKTQLAGGRSVMLGISVFQGFETTQDGYVPMFGAHETALGGHAIRCIGYRDDASVAGGGWLTLANSWGTGHGAAGRYFIPYAYLDFRAGEAGTMLSEAWALVAR